MASLGIAMITIRGRMKMKWFIYGRKSGSCVKANLLILVVFELKQGFMRSSAAA